MNEQRVSQSPDSPVAPSSGLNPVLLGHTQGALVSRDQVLITLSPSACSESLMVPSRLNLLRTITDFCHLHSSAPCPGPGSRGPHFSVLYGLYSGCVLHALPERPFSLLFMFIGCQSRLAPLPSHEICPASTLRVKPCPAVFFIDIRLNDITSPWSDVSLYAGQSLACGRYSITQDADGRSIKNVGLGLPRQSSG